MTPTASVIVTNHDYVEYVGEAIESALAQTEPTELVVVDDGSTDGSLEVIHRYESRATVVVQPNAGQAAAMNAGFAASTGDVVCFLDADDRLSPTAMRTAREALGADGAVAHWRLFEINAGGTRTGGLRPRGELGEGDLRALLVEDGPDCYAHPPTSGSAYARWFLDRVMPLPTLERSLGVGSASADAYLATVAPLHGRLARVADGQSDYRLHDTSDYSGNVFAERLRRDLATYGARCKALAAECARLGIEADEERWRRRAWVTRLAGAVATIEAAVPEGEPFLLIDDSAWGMDSLSGRRAVPFPERDGRWWGPPADDAAARAELDRAEARGVRYAVVGWPAMWWLDHYKGLAERLRAGAIQSAGGDVLIVELAREAVR